MRGKFWIANSQETLDNTMSEIKRLWELHHWLKIQIVHGKQRTTRQRAAIEVYCRLVAETLNDGGITFTQFFKPGFEVPWTQEIVKNNIWRVIQRARLDKESTTELDRGEVDVIYNIVNAKLSEHGIHVPFPQKVMK